MDKLKKLLPNKNQCCGLNLGCYEFVKMQEKIKDLEQELAESENKVKGFVELFDKKQHENYEQFCEIQELKHQLSITEKALELACDKIADMLAQNGGGAWFYDFDGDTVIERNGFENFYKRYAKEMLKDE